MITVINNPLAFKDQNFPKVVNDILFFLFKVERLLKLLVESILGQIDLLSGPLLALYFLTFSTNFLFSLLFKLIVWMILSDNIFSHLIKEKVLIFYLIVIMYSTAIYTIEEIINKNTYSI